MQLRADDARSSSTRPTGTARVEAGARWWDLIDQASEAGLAALHGSSPEINIVGYSLGGGVGWLARKHGLQANAVTAIELVTADGEQRVVDADNEPELFWALRGGGGNFGVVTAIEFELVPLKTSSTPGRCSSSSSAPPRSSTPTASGPPPGCPTRSPRSVRTLQLPDLEVIPEIVRGKSFAIIEAIYLGDVDEARELLAPLRELGPVMDTFARRPAVGAAVPAHGPDRAGALRRHPRDARRVHRAGDRRGAGGGRPGHRLAGLVRGPSPRRRARRAATRATARSTRCAAST